MYGKPGNSVENSNGTVHPRGNFPEKINTFRGITFFPFLQRRPRFSVPFVSITSVSLHVERKRKIYWYFVNGTTQSRSCFRYQKKYQYHLRGNFHRNFRTNGKRSKWHVISMEFLPSFLRQRRKMSAVVLGSEGSIMKIRRFKWLCSLCFWGCGQNRLAVFTSWTLHETIP